MSKTKLSIREKLTRLWALLLIVSVTGCLDDGSALPPLPKVKIVNVEFDDDDFFKMWDDKIKPDEATNVLFSVKNVDQIYVENLKTRVYVPSSRRIKVELVSPEVDAVSLIIPNEKRVFKYKITCNGENPGEYSIVLEAIDQYDRICAQSIEKLTIEPK